MKPAEKVEDKVDDMFVETPEDCIANIKDKVLNLPVMDVNEDNKGYYVPKLNEVINGQYKVLSVCGKGVFSTVIKVLDMNIDKEFAIKVISH